MKPLSQMVEINRRFARSTRLDVDLQGTPPLVGYVMQASVTKALKTLAESQIESQQGAFTWTGPYGGGKSSAALLVANLVAGRSENRALARDIAGPDLTARFAKAFPEANGPWTIVAVTGSRMGLRQTIADAAATALRWGKAAYSQAVSSDVALIEALMAAANAKRSGIFLILDELGKLLEHEASAGSDIHLLQDLAEQSARSKGKLVVTGILHQAFDQYVARASRDARQEWAKVQGRYQDIPFLAGA
ncbi:ATP-binding protein, partial [Gluconobacter cerinus]|nr:ATP-binding protein [Gluconobacter cerinus]